MFCTQRGATTPASKFEAEGKIVIAPTPNPKNLYIGAGELWLDRFDANQNPTKAFRHLGDADSLEINTQSKLLEKKSSMDGNRATYAQVVVGTDAEITIKLAELDVDNYALAVLGAKTATPQASTSTVTARDICGTALVLDFWFDLGVINPTVTDVKQGSTTLVAGVDYLVDYLAGLIKFPSTGAASAATAAAWDGSIPAIANLSSVYGLQTPMIFGHLIYRSAPNQVSGIKTRIDVWNASLQPSGQLQLIAETWGEVTLKGKVQLDLTKPFGQQYFRVMGPLPDGVGTVEQ
jgi:hypothetical protein